MRSRRLLGLIQLLHEFLAERAGVDAPGPAGQLHAEVVADLDLEVASVEVDGHRALAAAKHGRDRGAAGAGSGRQRLPHAALEDAGGYLAVAVAAPERHVGAVRE